MSSHSPYRAVSAPQSERSSERLIACTSRGDRLLVARESSVKTYAIEPEADGAALRRVSSATAPGPVTEVLCHGEAVFVSIGHGDDATLLRKRGEAFEEIARLPAVPRQMLGADSGIAILLPPATGRVAEILLLDARSGEALARRDATAGTTALRPASGQAVLAVDRRLNTVRRIDFDPRCEPQGGETPTPRPSADPEGDPGPNGRGGCACPGPKGGHRPEPPERRPVPPRRPPREICEDGSDGVQEDCFLYTVVGFSIVVRNICRPETPPCRRHLHSTINRIDRVGQSLFAVTRGGRSLVTLDAGSLNVLGERRLTGPGTIILTAPSAGRLLALAPDLSEIAVIQASTAALDLDLNLEAEVSEKIIEGTDSVVAPRRPQFALEQKSILIVPIVDPGQGYTPTGDLTPYHEALWTLLDTETDSMGFPVVSNAPLVKVTDYYAEQSDEKQNIDFKVFGVDTPNIYNGGPIEIEKPVKSYYYGAFYPGGLTRLVLLSGAAGEVAFRGDETRDITAISAVNANADDNANEFTYTLAFPAAIVRLDLDKSNRITIPSGGSFDWPILYDSGSLTLQQSDLTQNYDHAFVVGGEPFDNEVAELRSALAEMIGASPAAEDFAAIDVLWGKRPGETLGRLYVLFRFAGGGQIPRFTDLGTDLQIANFFGIDENAVFRAKGSIVLDTSLSASDKSNAELDFRDYLAHVMRLAEIKASDKDGDVIDPKLGSARFEYADFDGNVGFVTTLLMSKAHGGAEAGMTPGSGSGVDPLDLANASLTPGSEFAADLENTMIDKGAFYEMVYGRLIAAVQTDLGGAPQGGWDMLKTFLESFSTIYTFPIDPPPPGAPASSGWSVDGPASTGSLRAFVRATDTTIDPNGICAAAQLKWAMNFQSFDVVVVDRISLRESDTRTFGHELGHSLGLVDQYSSTKFDPTIQYIAGFDLMGSSQQNWPHFCAYHKLALGWWDLADQVMISRPGMGAQADRDFILVPTEWWGKVSAADARTAVSDTIGLPVAGVALCDVNGDGGVLVAVEARTPGKTFSADLNPPTGETGRVIVTNVLDYGESGRYGQIIQDAEAQPQSVVDGLLRYRRRIHPVATNLQMGSAFPLAGIPAFPVDGLTVHVRAEGAVTLEGKSVPIYHCGIEWTGTRRNDVGFGDNDEEWRSSDIAIDYLGEDPNNPESGPDSWPDGEPQGVGNKLVIPPDGGSDEPHRVLVRVRNFGEQTVNDVRVDLYLRVPGGGGELDGEEPYRTLKIRELEPVDVVGPRVVEVPWPVPPGIEPHICLRAQIRDFRIGTEAGSQIVASDASPTNNWAQQNIFEADVVYASPPEPLETRFSVFNDGPFTEIAHLVADGLPRGARLVVRPRLLRVPAFSGRNFRLRFEFDEELIDDRCRREMSVLIRCIRTEEHNEELWGASLFKFKLKRKTIVTVDGSWFGTKLSLDGEIEPAIGLGRVSLRLDFRNGQPATWIDAPLLPGGVFGATFDTGGINHDGVVLVTARYHGTPVFAPSTSPPVKIPWVPPAG